jgi:hypothetical protein
MKNVVPLRQLSIVEGKGVIEIIFNSEILAKFLRREDNRQ